MDPRCPQSGADRVCVAPYLFALGRFWRRLADLVTATAATTIASVLGGHQLAADVVMLGYQQGFRATPPRRTSLPDRRQDTPVVGAAPDMRCPHHRSPYRALGKVSTGNPVRRLSAMSAMSAMSGTTGRVLTKDLCFY